MNYDFAKPNGFVSTKTLVGLANAASFPLPGGRCMRDSSVDVEIQPLFEKVTKGEFKLEFTEPGEIEASKTLKSTVRLKAGVLRASVFWKSFGGHGRPKKVILVRLDDAVLQKTCDPAPSRFTRARAALVKAKAGVEAAELALDEYLSGSFRQEEEQMESAEFVARENLRRAEEYLAYSKNLQPRIPAGGTTRSGPVRRQAKELGLAMTKLEVLRVHSRQGQIQRFECFDLDRPSSTQVIRELSFELESTKEREISDQIAKCIISSPAAGEVTCANRNNSSSGDGIFN